WCRKWWERCARASVSRTSWKPKALTNTCVSFCRKRYWPAERRRRRRGAGKDKTMPQAEADLALHNLATQLRIDSIEATTAAGSGHPTSSMSAAELMAVLFFEVMRLDPAAPASPANDKFILSKGHAAPLLYSAWAELGLFPREHLKTLRQLNSDLEGHPTPRLPFVDVATGSLGQGLSVGVGMALCARLDKLDYRTYVLLGDGECAEGAVWEAASMAG